MTTVVGHRGAAGYAPENTLRSFATAIALGLTWAELDVRVTEDKELVVFHDSNVSQLTDGHGYIRDLSLWQLRKLKVKGEPIPTFQELADLCRGKIKLHVEMKSVDAPWLLNALLQKNSMVPDVIVSSFNAQSLRVLNHLNPDIRCCLLFKHFAGFWFERFRRSMWDYVKTVPVQELGFRWNVISQGLVEEVHAHGLKVYAYHVNTRLAGDRMRHFGVDSFSTDYPKLFLQGVTTS